MDLFDLLNNNTIYSNPGFEGISNSNNYIGNAARNALKKQNLYTRLASQLTDPNVGEMFGNAAGSGINLKSAATTGMPNLKDFANQTVGKFGKGMSKSLTTNTIAPTVATGAMGRGPEIFGNAANTAGGSSNAIGGMFNQLKGNMAEGGKALGKLGQGAVKYAPYLGGALMAGQGLSDIYEGTKTQDEINELVGDIGSTARGTPMLGEILDASTMRDVEQVQRRGSIRDETKAASAVKGALGELPAAAATTALIALLTGGASIPLSLAFGAGQLGLGATKGVKQSNETERARLQELYGQLSNARQMSKGMMRMPTQNYNVR